MDHGTVRGDRGRCWGVASVEMAIVAPILILLMFSIIEFGMMYRAALQVSNVARDAARAAGAGEPPGLVQQRVAETAVGLNPNELTLRLEYRPYLGLGYWSAVWLTLGTNGSENNAPTSSQIRATVTYRHHLMMPGLFRFMATDPAAGTKTLSSSVVMPRS